MVDIILLPLLVSLPLAVLTGGVGTILVWRRSSFLSDVVAHMGILAFAMSEFMGWPIIPVALGVALGAGLLLEFQPKYIPKDGWLASISAVGIGLGVIILSVSQHPSAIESVFLGDMLALTAADVLIFWIAAVFLCVHLKVLWKSLLLVLFHEQLARLDGIPVRWIKLGVTLISSVAVALSLKLMGVLLTGALFVLPSIGLRRFNLSPLRQALAAMGSVIGASVLGICSALVLDMPIAPLIAISVVILNVLLIPVKKGIDNWPKK